MKNHTRMVTLVLAMSIAAGLFSCGENEPEQKKDSTTAPDTTETTASDLNIMEQRELLDDGLGEKDFGGAEFNIITEKQAIADLFVSEEENGDLVNDVVYHRMVEIEDRFKIKIKTTATGIESSQHTRQLATLIYAGDDTYDLCQMHSMEGPNIALQGGLVNLYDVDQIDFSQPWWLDYIVDEQTFMGQLYCFNSPIETNVISGGIILFFNRDLIENRKLDDPYTLVKSGSWTMDKFYGMTKDVYEDLNGSGSADMDDLYGYAGFIGESYYTPVSAGLKIIEKGKDSLELTVNNERTVSFIEKWYQIYKSPSSHIKKEWATDEQEELFKNSRAMFVEGDVNSISSKYRDCDINFGMIPMPKLDENQEDYYTMGGRTQYGIPVTVKNLEMSGTIVEAMTCSGYKTLLPTYYEMALKNKYLRDEEHYEEALEALDIIERSLSIPFWYTFGNWNLFHKMMTDLYSKDSTDFASYYEKNKNTALNRLQEITEFFSENKSGD